MEGLNFILNAWNNKELKHLNTFVSMVESNDFTTTKITRIVIQIVIHKVSRKKKLPLRPNPPLPLELEILERWKKSVKKSSFFLNGPVIKRRYFFAASLKINIVKKSNYIISMYV